MNKLNFTQLLCLNLPQRCKKIMKNLAKLILQKTLGYHNYLFIFALYVIYTLKYQKRERDFLYFLQLLPKNKSVLDIGANIGVMTCHLSKHLSDAQVYAFEPQPDNLLILRKIIRFFKLQNAHVLNFALGESNEKIKMVLPIEGKTKLHGLSHICHESISDFNSGLHYEADMRRLDDVQEIQNESIGGIKLDVENFEFFVLKGGENILRKNKPIVYTELWENQNRINCIHFMLALGYECKQFCKGELVDYDKCPTISQNFFFIPVE